MIPILMDVDVLDDLESYEVFFVLYRVGIAPQMAIDWSQELCNDKEAIRSVVDLVSTPLHSAIHQFEEKDNDIGDDDDEKQQQFSSVSTTELRDDGEDERGQAKLHQSSGVHLQSRFIHPFSLALGDTVWEVQSSTV